MLSVALAMVRGMKGVAMNKTTVERVLNAGAPAEELAAPMPIEFPFDESASVDPDSDLERWDGLS